MDMISNLPAADSPALAYRVVRYAPNPLRDEWMNIGIVLFDPKTGQLQLRLIDDEDEFARVRRFHPQMDEEMIRRLRDHLEERTISFLNIKQTEGSEVGHGDALQKLFDRWDASLSNVIQFAPQKGVYSADFGAEFDRLYDEYVAPPRREMRVGIPGSRASLRNYCSQVWRHAKLWDRLERSVRVENFTFPGDPMRIDYSYRRNGARGYVQTLSVSRSPKDCKELAYTAARIGLRASFPTEFVAVTDVPLESANHRHQFVSSTLRDAGIEPIPLEGFAVWVAKLKPVVG